MSPFTLDYLARLEVWGLAAVMLQGVLVALSWVGWARATASARLRHRLACAHFAALALLPAATLLLLQITVGGMVAVRSPPNEALTASPPLLALAAPAAALWLAGVIGVAARLALEARGLRRLPLAPAARAVVRRVRSLTRARVQVREAEVASPLVMGLRRPVLVLPTGLGDRLSPDEFDAVLLHELVHVERGDFGWNLAQRLLLAALWFHPAAWLLHRRLRREREARCDALAVARGAKATALARALVRLAEAQSAPGLAMSLSGRTDLAMRLDQLLAPQRRGRAGSPAWAAAASILCLAALGAGRLALFDPSLRDSYVASAFGPTLSIQAHDPAGPFVVTLRQGRVVAAALGREPARVVQRGGRVTLLAPRQPPVDLTVWPQGAIFWQARR